MTAIITDQFRISNADSFVSSVLNADNNYYIFLGLSNAGDVGINVGFGRTTTWQSTQPSPIDNKQYLSHYGDTMLFGKKIQSQDVRRAIRKIEWSPNTKYDMYRHDYSKNNLSPNSQSARLYNSNFYVVNSDLKVYVCIDNGSHGDISGTTNIYGNSSKDEPTFEDLEPSAAGVSGDGYIWKYLFTTSPSDVVKFDSTEYIVLPSNWSTSTNFDIRSVRESGNSDLNENQIKKVYIEDGGLGYSYPVGKKSFDIIGDGTGAKVSLTFNSSGTITAAEVTNGGSGYTYGVVDLKTTTNPTSFAKLIPIIPPAKGHGYDIYEELGSDRVLLYARFDDSTKDFPIDTKFSQVGILKNPEKSNSSDLYTNSTFSSVSSIRLSSWDSVPEIGDIITQITDSGTAKGYVVSFETSTGVLKYYQDRSLYFPNKFDQTDSTTTSITGKKVSFVGDASKEIEPIGGVIDTSLDSSILTVNGQQIDLGVTFTDGISNSEINNTTGKILYLDNRSTVQRDIKQKEDIKIVLEF